jgi:hypothetical protein
MSFLVFSVVVMSLALVVALAVGRPADELVSASGVAEPSRLLVTRFIDRSRRYRRNGAIVGLVLAAVAFTAFEAESGDRNGPQLDLVPLFSIGLTGSIAGSVVAEAFRFRRPSGPRTASLDVRDPESYGDPVTARREGFVGACSLLAVVASLATGNAVVRILVLGTVVVALALLRRWGSRRIAMRGRPALDPSVAEADDEVRRMAVASGLSRPAVTLAALVVSAQFAALNRPGGLAAVNTAAAVMSLVFFALAVVWWWRNRSFGLVPAERAPRPIAFTAGRVGLVAALVVVPIILVLVARGA